MLGRSSKEKNVEDVVVINGGNVTIENPEDVFIEPGAVDGTVEVVNVGDVHVQSEGDSQGNPHRDYIVDGGEDVTIEGCEDVLVTEGSVSGDLVIKNTYDDVFLQTTRGVELRAVEDIFVNTRSIDTDDSVRVIESEDVWIHDGAIEGTVTAEAPEDILSKSTGAVTRGVEVESPETEGVLHLVDTGDVLIETGGIDGKVVADDSGDVLDDASF